MKLLIPTETKVKGSTKKTFPDPETINKIFFGSVKTYGGTENYNNNVYTVYDTATVETWYRPDITSDCRIYICGTGETWDVISRPEDMTCGISLCSLRRRKSEGNHKWQVSGRILSMALNGLEELAERLQEVGGDLKKTMADILEDFSDEIQAATEAAVQDANLPAHGDWSHGNTRKAIIKDAKVEWRGYTATIGVGF